MAIEVRITDQFTIGLVEQEQALTGEATLTRTACRLIHEAKMARDAVRRGSQAPALDATEIVAP